MERKLLLKGQEGETPGKWVAQGPHFLGKILWGSTSWVQHKLQISLTNRILSIPA